MSGKLGIEKLEGYDLYHIKYGRGAVVIAAPAGSHASRAIGRKNTAANLGRLYNMRSQSGYQVSPEIEEVLSIKEDEGFVTISVKFIARNPQAVRSTISASGIIRRVIPVEQVTLEVVESADDV